MAILRVHISFYKEILAIKGLLKEPVLVFGNHKTLDYRIKPITEYSTYEVIRSFFGRLKYELLAYFGRRNSDTSIPQAFLNPDFRQILTAYGCSDIRILDYFDKSADLVWDMNQSISQKWTDAFNTVIDIGSSEHVFDVRQNFENLFSMVREGGHLCLVVPCKGYFKHGFHTFSPEMILSMLELNGFDIRYLKYSTENGVEVADFARHGDVLMWVVGEKVNNVGEFVTPQQGKWEKMYQ